jgi:hypothetical protein
VSPNSSWSEDAQPESESILTWFFRALIALKVLGTIAMLWLWLGLVVVVLILFLWSAATHPRGYFEVAVMVARVSFPFVLFVAGLYVWDTIRRRR